MYILVEKAGILNDRAIQLAHAGSFDEALACLKRAVTIEKDNYLLWFNLGVTYRDAGKLGDARKALEKAYEINGTDEDVIEMLAVVCFDMKDYDDALVYCSEGIEFNENNPHLWNTAGVVYFNRKEYDKAAEAFEVAVTLNPYYYDGLFNLHDTYEELGNTNGAADVSARMKEIEKGMEK